MIETTIKYKGGEYEIDLAKPIDISIPVGRNTGPNAFYLPKADYNTVEDGGFVGDVGRGGSCNVENIMFSPHGNGTHTECIGHIAQDHILVNNILKRHFFLARLITVELEQSDDKSWVSEKNMAEVLKSDSSPYEALIVRTKPNNADKKAKTYGGTNPPYFSADAMAFINGMNIVHLLTDLPSVDKEDDNTLAAHHVFLGDALNVDMPKTITEMIYVDDVITDGAYWVDLQIAGFESDASPSKPILYKTRLK